MVSRIRDRRFVAVVGETEIVFAFAFFDHENINWTWQLAELFRIENGQIRGVEAIFHRAPYRMPFRLEHASNRPCQNPSRACANP